MITQDFKLMTEEEKQALEKEEFLAIIANKEDALKKDLAPEVKKRMEKEIADAKTVLRDREKIEKYKFDRPSSSFKAPED